MRSGRIPLDEKTVRLKEIRDTLSQAYTECIVLNADRVCAALSATIDEVDKERAGVRQ